MKFQPRFARPTSVLGSAALAASLFVSAFAPSLCAQDEPEAETVLVFQNGRVMTANGPAIDGGVVIVRGSTIVTVGPATEVAVPDGAQVVDCTGMTITPGLVDASTTIGVSRSDLNEEGEEINPHLRVLDVIDPEDKAFVRARRHGVTTVQVNPGNRNVIGGLGAVVKTSGNTVAEMLVEAVSGLRMTMGSEPSAGNRAIRGGNPVGIFYRRPTTRMGVVWEARRALYAAQKYMEQQTVPGQAEQVGFDPGMEVLAQVLRGEMPVRTTARQEQDIRTALRLADEFGYRTLVEEATEAWRVADELLEAEATVLFSSPSRETASEGAEVRWFTLNKLANTGVPFAICSGSGVGSRPLMTEATFAVRYGLSREVALAAITSRAAEVLGIEDRVGSLRAGLDADLVVWTGDPFEPTTAVHSVYIAGTEVSR
ncbi:MAG: amidohydrolase family protein [Planctomycetota bacterium]